MYDAPDVFRGVLGQDLDWIELRNCGPFPADIGGFQLAGDIEYLFPVGTILAPGQYLVVADKPPSFGLAYGFSNVGNFSGSLSDERGTIRLKNRAGGTVLEVTYGPDKPLPALTKGKGRSLILARPSFGQNDVRAWQASEQDGGSPGGPEPTMTNRLHKVRINELLANSNLPDLDFIELYNVSDEDIDISGCSLSDSPNSRKFIFSGIQIEAHSYLALDEISLGFKLKSGGDTVYFRGPNDEVVDAVKYAAQTEGVSVGRFPEGADDFYPLFPPTPFSANRTLWQSQLVINEIMYAPISGQEGDQFVELYNRGTNTIDLSNWCLTGGVQFSFPTGTWIFPGGYVVAGKNIHRLRENYAQLNATNSFGDFSGTLSGSGDHLAICQVLTNSDGSSVLVPINEVTYGVGGSWGQSSHFGGSSLELIDPESQNRFAASWADSDESGKAPWSLVEYHGPFEVVGASSGNRKIELVRLGAGECLIDDVELLTVNGNNLVANGTFESGLNGWMASGSHGNSIIAPDDPPGTTGSRLRLISTGAGEPVANCVASDLLTTPFGTPTVRARARWVRGDPRLLVRVTGTDLEAIGNMTIPRNLGTPGLRNSCFRQNKGPAIAQVSHQPVVPGAMSNVVVTAVIWDRDGINAPVLHYRISDQSGDVSTIMSDDGIFPDAAAADGIFTGLIPGQLAGTTVSFFIEARDLAVVNATSRYPPLRECVIRFGETASTGDFASWRVWMNSTSAVAWAGQEPGSDELIDCTIVYADQRVVYNASLQRSGDLLERGGAGSIASCVLHLPADDAIFGAEQILLEAVDPQGDPTLIREYAARWLARQGNRAIPVAFERFSRLWLDGTNAGLFIERQPTDTTLADSYYSGDAGELFKAELWLEPGAGEPTIQQDARLLPYFSATGRRNPGRYRWNWRNETANGLEYSPIFGLIDLLNAPTTTYQGLLEAGIDIEQWMNVLALEHLLGKRDVYGYGAGRNIGVYKPGAARWALIPTDLKGCLGTNTPAGESLFLTTQPEMARFLADPNFIRIYWQALQRLVDTAFTPAGIRAVIDPVLAVLNTNGVPTASIPDLIHWIDARRTALLNQIPPPLFSLSTGPAVVASNNLVVINGTGSPSIRVFVNGSDAPVIWTSPSNWTATLFASVSTQVQVAAQTFNGAVGLEQVSVTVTNQPGSSEALVINEIMHSPAIPGGAFVELFNGGDGPLDLTGIQLYEAGFSFPAGSWIPPHGFVVIAEDLSAFTRLYGSAIPIIGETGPVLSRSSGTLTLWDATLHKIVQKVGFQSAAPWPAAANQGASLQLHDWRRDNSRVCNWSAVSNSPGVPLFTPGGSNSVKQDLPALPRVYLNEVQALNNGVVRDESDQPSPWIELMNAELAADVSLAGWYLTDDFSNLKKWPFPNETLIASNGFLIVWAEGGSTAGGHGNFRLNASGGRVALVKDDPVAGPLIVDYVLYPELSYGKSFGSFPNGQSIHREVLASSSPGSRNPPPPVFINEWMASNSQTIDPSGGGSDDWFELYNASPVLRDLSGCAFTNAAGTYFSIPKGTVIAPRAFLLCWADSDLEQNGLGGDLHVNFSLRARGDQIYLITQEGALINGVGFGTQTADVSQGRWPDGVPDIRFMTSSTPGQPNHVANGSPPSINPVPDQVLVIGQTLRLQATAADPDSPWQTLMFSLLPDSPAGVAVTPGGEITWTPAISQAPGTGRIFIRVTDQGYPPWSATNSFGVTVNLAPAIGGIVPQSGGGFSIVCDSIAGKSYGVLYKDALDDFTWTPLGQTVTGTGQAIILPIGGSTNLQRFFRIFVGN